MDIEAAITHKKPIIKLGYFNLRGRAQVPRLLLEYLRIPYEDVLFHNQKQWVIFKNQHEKEWPLVSLPYLIDGDIRITETVPICNYLVRKYAQGSQKLMLGQNLKDAAVIDMYTWSIDNIGVGLVMLCWMQGPSELVANSKERFWVQQLEEKMQALQVFVGNKPWMLGYLSLFDFSIYQLIHYVQTVFSLKLREYPRLMNIERKIKELPEIREYEKSSRAIKTLLPTMQNRRER